MSPIWTGPLLAWRCARCGWVCYLQPGLEPPGRLCGNYYAGCVGRQYPMSRVPVLDLPARETERKDADKDGGHP